jgi:Glycosyltransferase family 87
MMEQRKVTIRPPLKVAPGDVQPRTLLVGLLLLISCLYLLMARESYMGDFRAFYLAASATQNNLDPYRNNVDIDEKYADGVSDRMESRFIYPPSALFFFAPFSKLPYKYAKFIFGGVVALLMGGLLTFFYMRFSGLMAVFLALFVSFPMMANVDTGQTDILILALLLAAFYLEDGWMAGMCLAVAISIKLAPILAIGWFLGQRRWRTTGWSLLVSGCLTLFAVKKWGTVRYVEFFEHLQNHANWHSPTLHHQFQTVHLVGSRMIDVGGVVYTLDRDIYGHLQNPLHLLGHYGSAIGFVVVMGYLVWLFFSAKGRSLSAEAGFLGFLVAAPFANTLLWEMGEVVCFPLLLLLVHRSRTPAKTALLLLTPLFFPLSVVADHRFVIWLGVAAFCLWRLAHGDAIPLGGEEIHRDAIPSS